MQHSSAALFAKVCSSLLLALTALTSLNTYAQNSIVVGALGDSITVAFDARSLGDNPALSWSTGTSPDVMSHLRRLQAIPGNIVTGYNAAKAGAQAADLFGQLANLQSRNPNYVTIAIGANDVCAWNDVYSDRLATFERDVRIVLNQLVQRNPAVRIVLSPIPDMYNLWEVAHTRNGCQSKWNLFNICQPLLGRNRTELERQAFVGRWQAANDTLAHLATEFADNVKYNPDLETTRFAWEDVAPLDCFHPSVRGQNLLAEKTWENGWFADQ